MEGWQSRLMRLSEEQDKWVQLLHLPPIFNGPVVQLGERLLCTQDVVGSSPTCVHQFYFIESIRLVLNGKKSSSEMPFVVIPYRQ